MVLPLSAGTYVEVVEVLDHPASDKAPFGQAVRARSALGGGWLGWVVSVDDIAKVEARLGRESVQGNRHRPDGVELRWRQIGVKGLQSDPQLPFFIQWQSPADAAPQRGQHRPGAARHPRDRRRPEPGQRLARQLRRGPARGRRASTGSPPTAPPAWSRPSSHTPNGVVRI